jgi:tRNA (adenine-N(1)-)-methyltransferase non-catalytic subunit
MVYLLALSLLIASDYDPVQVFWRLFPFLSLSSPFAVYCRYPEPLAEIANSLRKITAAVNIELTETWMRQYQVLPSRTHPMMRMDGASGFILSGTKVEATNAPK